MSVGINVVLSEETLRVLDRVAARGKRSRMISDAVMHYVASRGRSRLAEQLKAGALANGKRDLAIAEMQRTRPALVIQSDIGNQYSPITIVAAITLKFGLPPYLTEVVMEPNDSGLRQRSAVALNQICSVDRQRMIKRVGKVGPEAMRSVDRAVQISLGLVDI